MTKEEIELIRDIIRETIREELRPGMYYEPRLRLFKRIRLLFISKIAIGRHISDAILGRIIGEAQMLFDDEVVKFIRTLNKRLKAKEAVYLEQEFYKVFEKYLKIDKLETYKINSPKEEEQEEED